MADSQHSKRRLPPAASTCPATAAGHSATAAAAVITRLENGACGHRHGLLAAPMDIPLTAADISGVHHASVAREGDHTTSAGGGVGRSRDDARAAAVGEALERYVAARATLPARPESRVPTDARVIPLREWTLHIDSQLADPAFPLAASYPDEPWMVEAFSLLDNEPVWVPAALVGLSTDFGALASSSGLAADPSALRALLRATQELVERDAFMATWLHGVRGRRVAAENLDAEVAELDGEVAAYDITPVFSRHPVALVAGRIPQGELLRSSVGLACRADWQEAVEKAYLEFLQGVLFSGYQLARFPELTALRADDVRNFDHHAVYYTANPREWEHLPIHSPQEQPAPQPAGPEPDATRLRDLVTGLEAAGIAVLYRELTTSDVAQLGMHVVRTLSPQLTPIHHDHQWPFLGGTTAEVAWRYPWHRPTADGYPSPFPHPLG